MEFTFDLISDLHLESWNESVDWTGRPTSPHCVIAGDICYDRSILIKFLKHLSQCYQGVFYIDGNDEHKLYMNQLGESYQDLAYKIRKMPNVVYLQDNVVVVNGVALIGTNGWWGYDLDLSLDSSEVQAWLKEKESYSDQVINSIRNYSKTDAKYIVASIKRLQTHPDVKKIVVISHTVPRADLIEHDPGLLGKLKFNCMGNRYIAQALDVDTEHKIHTWCFGHYHGKVDQYRDGVRWVNNCRGRKDTLWSQWAYNPLRVVIDY